MTEKLNLYQKIADVKANIDGFTKDTRHTISYVSGSQILHRIRTKMIEHNYSSTKYLMKMDYHITKIVNRK